MTKNKINLDIFISHAWRFHEEWKILVDILDEIEILTWRNFSVPWHDPALRPTNEIGMKSITNTLKGQIIPCHICFFLTDLYVHKSNSKWLEMSQKFVDDYNKKIFFTGINHIEPFKEKSNFVPLNKKEIENIIINNFDN